MRSNALILPLLLGCGDPIVGDDYLGTPVFALQGSVVQAEPAPVDDARLSLFWIGLDSRTHDRGVVEQRTTLDSAFARFNLAVFNAPPPEALAFDGAGIALLVVYADGNDNDALNADLRDSDAGPDTILGASPTHLVVYATARLSGAGRAAEILGDLEPGYHLFETDDSSCAFARAFDCVGAGTLRKVQPEDAALFIRLESSPDAVMVPNPAVPGPGGSMTEPPPGNLYGP